ncbi:5-carboxymethyl-2-hydroxymuconate semialdehyde dehydrogenase [Paenibacillus pectinilyticus]|uniref:5-carboxymethyl-2-hydroxymuconate semialdehyde dehydrogenase n=1 Tax=Paenibacillus pectinilyticus TaxID=512399 RepID=A0A1C0ZRP6_9BACL|nr:aldehyde dehydrogenase [Paenibacillus pectinilyticus]OCT10739.1 5-carboxymethyl-2-hydroxymuconate semialdehyde dehydrogenase [Paenibacillus pectinilyticus]
MVEISKGFDCQHFIGGTYIPIQSEKSFENINPATEEVIGRVAEGSQEEVDLAVEAAKNAFNNGWKNSKVSERAAILRKIGDLLLEKKEQLAMLETMDTGKPLWLSTNVDIPRAAGSFHFYANFISTMGTDAYPMEVGAVNIVVRRPLGVVGMINPWNLPLLLLCAKLAPCLAMGNTVVLKPARWTPMTATLLGQICKEAGLPDGVINVVNGNGRVVGEALSAHPDIRAIAFTGETSTGKSIMKAGAESLKRFSFELGGKNPNIIFEDCDLDTVIDTTLRSSFINQGAVCLCGSRIYVQRSIYEEFMQRFVARTKEQIVGDPMQPNTNIGALISKQHYERVLEYIELARAEGGTIETGGKRAEGQGKGYYVEPTIISGLDKSCRVTNEEIFGPVVTVQPFDTEEEVIQYANDTHYGLSASVWTKDSSRGLRVAHQIEAGTTWVNTWFLRDPRTPYGGEKQSGIGRQGGMFSLDFYSEVSTICVKY